MTFPEPRYLGDDGEIRATFRPAEHGPELTFPNGRSGPDPHFHRSDLRIVFRPDRNRADLPQGTSWIDTAPGDFVHVPEGGIHGFRNESGEPASVLLHFAPGAPREEYFEGLADFAVTPALRATRKLAAFYLRHDNVWR